MFNSQKIQVYLRFRPINNEEIRQKEAAIWELSPTTVCLKPEWTHTLRTPRRQTVNHAYAFKQCFAEHDSNHTIYHAAVRPLVEKSLDGLCCSVFAYGQTGSGKTYTMTGELASKGVIYYALEDIARTTRVNATCSYLEIYNENVYDLLADQNALKAPLIICEDKAQGFYARGATMHPVKDSASVISLYHLGESNRQYACTSLNHKSSRSHTIFTVHFQDSSISFIDLAGNERVCLQQSRSVSPQSSFRGWRSTMDVKEEGKYINVSLFHLCQVILKLSEGKPDTHIPYRNSNLTKLLKASLTGNSLNSFICTATPVRSQFELTLSTLKFGGIASTITLKPAQPDRQASILRHYREEIRLLQARLQVQECMPDSLEFSTEDAMNAVSVSRFEEVCRERNKLELKENFYKKKIQVMQDCIMNVSDYIAQG